MPVLRATVRFACLAMVLVSCVSSRESEPDPEAFDVRYCRYLAACGPAWLSQFEGGTEAACREAVACSSFGIVFPTAQECPDAASERCAVLDPSGACDPNALPGEGEPCAGFSCRPGLSCDLEGGCPTCRPAARLGAPCSSGFCDDQQASCEAGRAFCDRATHTCQALRRAGEPCEGGQECDGLSCIEGVCAPGRLEGEACAWTPDCASYLVCRDGKCARRARAGEACGSDWPDCQAGLRCVQNVCEKALCAGETPRVGSPCAGAVGCGDGGLFCDAESGRCARTLELGAACEPPEGLLGLARGPCGPNAYCSAEEKRCVTALGEGESCNGAQCATGLACMPEGDCDLLCGCDLDESTHLVCRRLMPPSTMCDGSG